MKIVICTKCKGHGEVRFDVGTHKPEYEIEKCNFCGGSGRMEEMTNVARIPFIPGKSVKDIH